ncbi:MAG: hypothetical protein WC695_01270 [Candidatus Omnitrophota bacterium]
MNIAERVVKFKIKDKYALAFQRRVDVGSRLKNENLAKKLKFIKIDLPENDSSILREIILQRLKKGSSLNLLVDFSSMTKVWYATILQTLSAIKTYKNREINLFFAYSPAKFSKPTKTTLPNEIMDPLPGFCNLELPNDRQTALILGLGYDHDRASGLYQYIDPGDAYVFYANPSHDARFVSEVRTNNASLFRKLKDNVISYPGLDLITTYNYLNALSFNLLKKYRVILAPLGPKPFSLLCFVMLMQFPELKFDIWRVSLSQSSPPDDRIPAQTVPIVLKVTFRGD